MEKMARVLACLILMLASQVTAADNDHIKYEPFNHNTRDGPTVKGFSKFRTRRSENITKEIKDHHVYYTSTFIPPGLAADNMWFELSDLIGSGAQEETLVTETLIQDLFRFYEVWPLQFSFPFYGHLIDSVAITTGGFLYVGGILHDQIHLTQYIAPLQANFNPSLNDTARILVYDTESRFTVQWNQVYNHDHVEDGPFSFQVSLFPNGSIYFVYREIPLALNMIDNDDHPVEVGLADAFYVYTVEGQVTYVYIYEYSRIQLNATANLNYSAYVINPVTNCVYGNSCDSCLAISQQQIFDCSWCPSINRCSDGLDRLRQSWFQTGCINTAVRTCGTSTSSSTSSSSVSSSSSSSTVIETSTSSISSSSVSSSSKVISSHTSSTMITSTAMQSSHFTGSSKVISSHTSSTMITSTAMQSSHFTSSSIVSSSLIVVTPTFVPTALSSSQSAAIGLSIIFILILLMVVVIGAIAIIFYVVRKKPTLKLPRNTTVNYSSDDKKVILEHMDGEDL